MKRLISILMLLFLLYSCSSHYLVSITVSKSYDELLWKTYTARIPHSFGAKENYSLNDEGMGYRIVRKDTTIFYLSEWDNELQNAHNIASFKDSLLLQRRNNWLGHSLGKIAPDTVDIAGIDSTRKHWKERTIIDACGYFRIGYLNVKKKDLPKYENLLNHIIPLQ